MQKDFSFINDTSFSTSQFTNASSILHRPLMINKIKQRLMPLSPTVKLGIERECCKGDFKHDLEDSSGKGSFGEVYKVTHNETGKIYAIKVLDKNQILEKNNTQLISREIEIMYKLNHPHVMNLINHFEDEDKIYLIMPYAGKGQLYKHLKRKGRFDERAASQYVLETMEAVSYLHSFNPKIVHRDIKPENLLFDDNLRIKLTDFGLATYLKEGEYLTIRCGSNEYMAPEVLRGQKYDETCDIWAIGVLLFELLTGYTPFVGNDTSELISNIKKVKIKWPNDFHPLAKNLISKILRLNPKERISLEEIKNHAWFNRNSPFRPMLQIKTRSSQEMLEYHLINGSMDNFKGDLQNIDFTSPSKFFHKSPSNNSLDNSILSNISDRKGEYGEIKHKLTDYQFEISRLRKINENQEDQINELERQVNELKENNEKNEYLLQKKDIIIKELELKISQKDNEITVLSNEKHSNDIELKALNSKINSYQKESESQIREISKLNETIETITKLKDEFMQKYQAEKVINQNLQKIQKENLQKLQINGNLSTKSLIEILTHSLRETKQMLSQKIEAIETNLYEIKTNQQTCSEMLRDVITKQIGQLNDLVYEYQNSLLKSIEDTMVNVTKSQLEKKEQMINFLKDKNKELQNQIALLQKEDNAMLDLKADLESYKEKYIVLKKQIDLNNKMVTVYTEKSQRNEKRYLDLKYQIQVLKDTTSEIVNKKGKIEEILNLISEL